MKVVVIGAGVAGLTAAYELLKQCPDAEVIILEESDCVGGISRTVRYKNNRMDLGGHRFFSKSERVNSMWEELMPLQGKPAYDDKKLRRKGKLIKGNPDPEKEDIVMLIRKRISRIFFGHKFYDYPITAKVFLQFGFIKTIEAGISYLKSCLFKLPETNLENFYINRFGKVLYSMFFEGYTEKLWGRHPSVISADWGAQRVKGISISAVLEDMLKKLCGASSTDQTSLIEEFTYPKYGVGQMWEVCADKVREMGGTIVFNSKVTNICVSDGKITHVVADSNGSTITYDNIDYLFSSMPIKDLVNDITVDGAGVPEHIRCIANGLPYRDFMTVGIKVRRLLVKNTTKYETINNNIPDCWIYVQDSGLKMGRIQVFNNWSPYMVDAPDRYMWLGLEYFCQEGDKYWCMPDEKFAKAAARELVRMKLIKSEREVLDYHVVRVKKAYPAYFDTYSQIDEVISYLDTFSNLYCIGRNGQHRYNNMDHSMMTAFEAVDNIISSKKDKGNVWNVNTEKVYHEKK